MIHIKKEDKTINKQTDTTNLNAIYDKYILITDLINALHYDFHTSLNKTFEIIQQR